MNFFQTLWIFSCFLFLYTDCNESTEFGYSKKEQAKWKLISKQCGGKKQSPVHIVTQKAKISRLPVLKFINYKKNLPGPILVQNNGHTVSFSLPSNGRVPKISGSNLRGTFEIHSFHFHWGSKNSQGSEHVLNDKRFPIELHILHTNKKYNRSLQEALKHKDGIVVLGILYKFTNMRSKDLRSIVKHLSGVREAGQQKTISAPSFSMSSLFSGLKTRRYFKYVGSLTTPPCSEVVTWIVFPQHLPSISEKQLLEFRKLKNRKGHPLVDNFRKVQSLNGRVIRLRTA